MNKYAVDNNIAKIIVLGDLFHNRDHINIDVLCSVVKFFESSNSIEWIVLPGNHDMFLKTSWDINSIKPLNKYATICDSTSEFIIDNRKFVVLPFIHFESEYMKSLKFLEDRYGEDDILITHIGVNNAINNTCFLLKNWSDVSFTNSKFNLILSGHYHVHQIVDDKVCYPGSPISFRFDDGMVPHGFLDMDTESLQVNFVNINDAGGKFYDNITVHDDNINISKVGGNRVRIILSREYSNSELEKLRNELLSQNAISVSWMKPQDVTGKALEIKINESKSIFEQWFDQFKDKDEYDKALLMGLYKTISELGDEEYLKEIETEYE
jgi:DNA repair exonuclease SbcCD nuclease subunit